VRERIDDIGGVVCYGLKFLVDGIPGMGKAYSKKLWNILICDGVDTGPDSRRWNSIHIELCNNSEITASSFQSPEEICVVILGSIHDLAVGENNFVLKDAICSKAMLISVKVYTTSKKEAWCSNWGETTTRDRAIEGLKITEYIPPPVRWSN
jgi:hypothetical protein